MVPSTTLVLVFFFPLVFLAILAHFKGPFFPYFATLPPDDPQRRLMKIICPPLVHLFTPLFPSVPFHCYLSPESWSFAQLEFSPTSHAPATVKHCSFPSVIKTIIPPQAAVSFFLRLFLPAPFLTSHVDRTPVPSSLPLEKHL